MKIRRVKEAVIGLRIRWSGNLQRKWNENFLVLLY
jgi:hypothetical protein